MNYFPSVFFAIIFHLPAKSALAQSVLDSIEKSPPSIRNGLTLFIIILMIIGIQYIRKYFKNHK